MIFVILGTQKQSFVRLLKEIENSVLLRNEQIIVQAGHTKYTSDKMEIVDFLSETDFHNTIASAEFVITHGGVGSIFSALLRNKKVIAVPRLKKFKEHVDNHQVEICRKLADMNHIVCFDPEDSKDEEIPESLDTKINFIRTNYFEPYYQQSGYLGKIDQAITELL